MSTQHESPSTDRSKLERLRPEDDGDDALTELLINLWEGRYIITGAVVVALLVGAYYNWRKSPIYQTDALVQIEDKKLGKAGAAAAALEGMFEQTTLAQAEIEIIRSNLVLSRAIETLNLDVIATPRFHPLIGDALVRDRSDAPEVDIDRFELPNYLRGTTFEIITLENGAFRWLDSKGGHLAEGRPGVELKIQWKKQPMTLKVRNISGAPGQRFHLTRRPLLKEIQELRKSLRVAEKGKKSNILGLSLEHRNPARGAEILNEILKHYIRQNIERKAEEASKTLAFLQEQMPQLRGKLDVAENDLNQYRMRSGSVDLPEEAKLLLKQSVDMEGQLLQLKQKKEELLRTYNENSDVVGTLNDQMDKLRKEASNVEGKVRGLPRTQQEVVRLHREVQVSNELYTALLNNVQQLQMARAGEIGNARVVDHAMPGLLPTKPQKGAVQGLSGILGLFAGVGMVVFRRTLHRGVEDPKVIESRLGLPVIVTIPHSEQQIALHQKMRTKTGGHHLLVQSAPEDLAVESLRSLRTSLAFTMMDAQNHAIMISGPSPSIGKSFVSSNLATVLAQVGAKVLLVDGDMRKGNLHLYFGIDSRKGGLSEVLAGVKQWKSVVHTTEIPGLEVISTGILPPNPSELLMSGHFADFVQEVSTAYDLVIIDAPPVLAVTDPVIIGSQVGTCLLLAKAKAHPLDEIRTAIKRFERAGIQVKGCIFNDVPAINVGYRYYRYTYHYNYK